jgi:phage terminase small subunit
MSAKTVSGGDCMIGRACTAKEAAFASAVALEGKSYSGAYRATRDCSRMTTKCINSNAKKIARRSHVQRRIAELKGAPAEDSDLTPKMEAFALHFVETSNASGAYRRAYNVSPQTKPETVHRAAHELLHNPKIAARIAGLRALHQRRHEITIDRVKEEYARLAFANMEDYVVRQSDRKGRLDLTRVTREQMAAVQEMTFETVLSSDPEAAAAAGAKPTENGKTPRVTVLKTKFRLHDKKGALDSLAKHLGMFQADNEQAGRAAAEAAVAVAEISNRDLARAVLDILREAQIASSP